MERFGFAMGPFRVGDLAGNDIGWAIRKRRAAEGHARERGQDRRSAVRNGPLRTEDRAPAGTTTSPVIALPGRTRQSMR